MFLHLDNVTVSYNRIPAIHHISLDLPYGSCVGLVGPNGAGKTTLLKAIAKLLPLETGSIQCKMADEHLLSKERNNNFGSAHPVQQNPAQPFLSQLNKIVFPDSRLTPHSNKSVAYVPQREAVDWDFPITVRALVEMGRYASLGAFRSFTRQDHEVVEQSIIMMSLQELAGRQIKALSGGQQQRAFLARACAQEADIYLLDEPFTGLDQTARIALTNALHQLRNRGKLIIASHHDFSTIVEIFDHIIMINGELIAKGPTPSTFVKENIDRTFSVPIFTGKTRAHFHS